MEEQSRVFKRTKEKKGSKKNQSMLDKHQHKHRHKLDQNDGVSTENSAQRSHGTRHQRDHCRDSKLRGCDLYVARISKCGQASGKAAPCWRCIQWSKWAGVKRIYHWNEENGRFEAIKLNDPDVGNAYETTSDGFLSSVCLNRSSRCMIYAKFT